MRCTFLVLTRAVFRAKRAFYFETPPFVDHPDDELEMHLHSQIVCPKYGHGSKMDANGFSSSPS